ncbi:MAG: hypothetical protein Kow0092_36500 [Deferrisomatales bacterium]
MIQQEEQVLLSDKKIEGALLAVHRSVCAHQFYPPGHPSLQQALKDGYKEWRTGEKDHRWEQYGLQLRGGALWLGETRLGEGNPALASLARTFAAHGLAGVRRLGPLSADGFAHWASLLGTAPEVLAPQGGLAALWRRTPYKAALELTGLTVRAVPPGSEGREAPAGPAGEWGQGLSEDSEEAAALADPALLGRLQAFRQRSPKERRVLELLLQLGRTEDMGAFLALLREVSRHVEGYLYEERFREAFHVVLFLYREAQNMDAVGKGGKRDYLLEAVRRLVRKELLTWLTRFVATERGAEEAEVGEYVLRFLGKDAVVPLLNALVAERSRVGRRRLLDVLVAIGPPVVPWAMRMLEDQRWYVVRNMVTILGGVGTPEAVKALLRVAGDPDSRLRKEVARALGRVTGEQAAEELRKLLDDPDPGVRLMAVGSAAGHRTETMLDALWGVFRRVPMRSSRWNARVPILQSIGRMGLEAAVGPLERLVRRRPLLWRSRWRVVRLAALQALGEIGGERARRILEELRDHRDAEVSKVAVRALATLGGPTAGGRP